MAFLLEGEADETLAAAMVFLDEQQKVCSAAAETTDRSDVEVSNDVVLPSLDDPEAAEVLDALSAELPAVTDKAVKNVSWTAAIPAPKLISQRRFKRHQVAPCPPQPPAPKTPITKPAGKKPYGTDIPYRWYHSKSAGSIESTEDTMVECFGMEMFDAKSKTTAEFNVKQILRRYVEEDRVVVVWRSHIEPLEFSNKRFAGIHFQEKGYVVIKPRAHNYDSADNDDFTLVQTCYIITPDLSDQTLNEDAKTGALTEFVLSSTAANISASNEMIENVLLDQALQQRKRGD
ncbi:hypothetical protein PF010_g4905 [Phytophthora fragariae]|uniref:Uncharacterized protein n=1 Tax=Phytophthora fragariae TaxID=53985 RepID=A0A6G0LRE1_9STRA|nr:hypothetical protein PF010_g4905 [Phytophthora fragariae]